MVKVLYVEKREAFAGKGRELLHEFRDVLMIPNVESVRVVNRYLVEDLSDDAFATAKECIFSEPPTDDVYEEMDLDGKLVIAVEYLPGQFDQRAASAVDCVRLIDPEARVDIRSSRLLVFDDKATDGELAKIRHYYINAVESREKDLSVLSDMEQAEVKPVGVLEGFREMADSELEPYCKTMGLAMNADDLREVVKYFRSEGRDPYET